MSRRYGDHDCLATVRALLTPGAAMPFVHVGGGVLAVPGAMYAAATLRPLLAILQHPDGAHYNLSSLHSVVSGATMVPCPPDGAGDRAPGA